MFRDVTLAWDDNRNIQTHKGILVAVNQVEEGFKENNKHQNERGEDQHPVGARARNISGPGGEEWPAASTLPHISTSTHPNL